jgi:transcriptional antiterminator RfaH
MDQGRLNQSAWMIISYNTKLEVMVAQQLMARGFEFYRPMTQRKRRIARVRMVVSTPLYPGYMFIRPNAGEHIGSVAGLIGMTAYFTRGVTDQMIERHKAYEVDGFIACVSAPGQAGHRVGVGDKVRTLDGLMDFVVQEVLPENRVAALMRFMGGDDRPVIIDLANVQKVTDEDTPKPSQPKARGTGKKKKR